MSERSDAEIAGAASARIVIENCDMGRPDEYVKGFLFELRRSHRTHQQDVVRALTVILSRYAEVDFDLRNEAAVELCQKLKPVIQGNLLPRL